MIPWIIQSGLISFILIFLIHYLFTFFKENLTVPKVIDLVNKPKEQYEELLTDKDTELKFIEERKNEIIKEQEAAYKKQNKTYNYQTSEEKKEIDARINEVLKEKEDIEKGYAETGDSYIKEKYIENQMYGRYKNLANNIASLGSFDSITNKIKDLVVDTGNSVSSQNKKKVEEIFTRAIIATNQEAIYSPVNVLEMSNDDLNKANSATTGNEFTVGIAGALTEFSENLEIDQGELNVLEKNIKENYIDKNLEVPSALMAQLVDKQDDYDNQVAKYNFSTDNLETVISDTNKKLTSASGEKISNKLSEINTTINSNN